MPSHIRKGKPLVNLIDEIHLTANGRKIAPQDIKKRAPKQAELMSLLKKAGPMTSQSINKVLNQWKNQKKILIEKGWISVSKIVDEQKYTENVSSPIKGPKLNSEQEKAIHEVKKSRNFKTFLLDGITGSGKTEVYLQLILQIINQKKQCLILVPEIGLTNQFVNRLIKRVGIQPTLLHSGLTENERFQAWRAINKSEARIVLGTRSAIFAPLKNLGIIIVDEENDISYKQQEGFRYSARDLAIIKAKNFDIPIIIGSATPSLESLYRHRENKYVRLTLPKRAGKSKLPSMHLIDLNKERSTDGLSSLLIKAIKDHLEKNGQALIYINRRGYAPTLICQSCNHVAQCSRCDSRMTVYLSKKILLCHHCGSKEKYINTCKACHSEYIPLGQGTQRIEEALKAHFPNVVIKRIDSDSTRAKGSIDLALEAANSGKAKILVGTQMLSKGHHFSSLSLVAVINADQGLFSTDFRGSERLAQNIIQVAGRAGREEEKGQVVIQTEYPEHPFWGALFKGGYSKFAELTLNEREETNWPPFSYLALIRAKSHKKSYTWDFLNTANQILSEDKPNNINIMGPISAPMERKAGKYRGQLLLQSTNRKFLHKCISLFIIKIEEKKCVRRVKWSIDIDPIELF